MRYKMTKEEQVFVLRKINELLEGRTNKVDFTGTTISPYNLRFVLREAGFVEDTFDNNSTDYWWYFKHPKIDRVEMFFNAESFELVLTKEE